MESVPRTRGTGARPELLHVEEFRTSSRIVPEGDEIRVVWKTSGASSVSLCTRPMGQETWDPLPTDELLSGRVSLRPSGDTQIRLDAKAGEAKVHREISVVTIARWGPLSVLVAAGAALVSIWYVSENFFLDVDAVQHASFYRAVQLGLSVFGFATALLGAPLLVTVARLRSETNLSTLSAGLLRSVGLSVLFISLCAAAVGAVGYQRGRAHVVRFDNRLERSVQLTSDGDLRAVVPPGLSSVLVFESLGDVRTWRSAELEGLVQVCPDNDDGDGMCTLTCPHDLRVVGDAALGNEEISFSALWDDGERAGSRGSGAAKVRKHWVATRFVKDCASFPSSVEIDLETKSERLRLRVASTTATEPKAQEIKVWRSEPAAALDGLRFATMERFPDWATSGECRGGSCGLVLPVGRHDRATVCLSSLRNPDGKAGCEAGRGTWISATGPAAQALVGTPKKKGDSEEAQCQLATRSVCIPPTVDPRVSLRLQEDGFGWSGTVASVPANGELPYVACADKRSVSVELGKADGGVEALRRLTFDAGLDTAEERSLETDEPSTSDACACGEPEKAAGRADDRLYFEFGVLPSFVVKATLPHGELLLDATVVYKAATAGPGRRACQWAPKACVCRVGRSRYRFAGVPQWYSGWPSTWEATTGHGKYRCTLAYERRGWRFGCALSSTEPA